MAGLDSALFSVITQALDRSANTFEESAQILADELTVMGGTVSAKNKLKRELQEQFTSIKRTTNSLTGLKKQLDKQGTSFTEWSKKRQKAFVKELDNLDARGELDDVFLKKFKNNAKVRFASGNKVIANERDLSDGFARLSEKLGEQLKQQQKNESARKLFANDMNTFGKAAKVLTLHFDKTIASIALMGSGFIRIMDETRIAQERQVGMYSLLSLSGYNAVNLLNNFQDATQETAAALGMTSIQAQMLVAENRQLIASSGGIRQAFKAMDDANDIIIEYTGTWEAANKAAMGAMKNLATIGIDDEFHQLGATLGTVGVNFAKAAKMQGLSEEVMRQQVETHLQSLEIQQSMQALGKQQRRIALEELSARTLNNIQLGYSTERMLEAERLQKRQAMKGPISRLRRSIAARQAGTMLNMDPKATAEVAELIRKGITDDPRLNKFMTELTKRAEAIRGPGGNFEKGAVIETIMNKGGLIGQFFNEAEEATNALGRNAKAMALSRQEMNKLVNTGNKGLEGLFKGFTNWIDSVKAYLGDPATSIIGGAASTIGGFVIEFGKLLAMWKIYASITKQNASAWGMMQKPFESLKSIGTMNMSQLGKHFLTAGKFLGKMAIMGGLIAGVAAAMYSAYELWKSGGTKTTISTLIETHYPNVWEGIVNWLGGGINAIIELPNTISNWWSSWNFVDDVLKPMLGKVLDWILVIPNLISDAFTGIRISDIIKANVLGDVDAKRRIAQTGFEKQEKSGSMTRRQINFVKATNAEISRINPSTLEKFNNRKTLDERETRRLVLELKGQKEDAKKASDEAKGTNQELINLIVQQNALLNAIHETSKEAKEENTEGHAATAEAASRTTVASSPASQAN